MKLITNFVFLFVLVLALEARRLNPRRQNQNRSRRNRPRQRSYQSYSSANSYQPAYSSSDLVIGRLEKNTEHSVGTQIKCKITYQSNGQTTKDCTKNGKPLKDDDPSVSFELRRNGIADLKIGANNGKSNRKAVKAGRRANAASSRRRNLSFWREQFSDQVKIFS